MWVPGQVLYLIGSIPDLCRLSYFEYSLKLTIKRMSSCLRTRVRKQPLIALYFEFENELKFYNLGVWLKSLKFLRSDTQF